MKWQVTLSSSCRRAWNSSLASSHPDDRVKLLAFLQGLQALTPARSPPWPVPAPRPEAAFQLLQCRCSPACRPFPYSRVVRTPPSPPALGPSLPDRACSARFSFEVTSLADAPYTPRRGHCTHGAFRGLFTYSDLSPGLRIPVLLLNSLHGACHVAGLRMNKRTNVTLGIDRLFLKLPRGKKHKSSIKACLCLEIDENSKNVHFREPGKLSAR